MRLIRDLVGMLLLAVGISSCFKAPEFPIIPEISFNNITFEKGPPATKAEPSPADTLSLAVNFKDGDGDLGLDALETDYPVNDKYYVVDPDGYLGYFGAGDTVMNNSPRFYVIINGTPTAYSGVPLITYNTKRLAAINDPAHDTLPPFITPYSCSNWEEIHDAKGLAVDTLYFQSNPNHFNFWVDFYVKQPDNSFKLYDWKNEFVFPNCNIDGFNGRFPILSKDLTRATAQEGIIHYNMKSIGFLVFFSIKVLKLKFYIQDRALHKSNVVETPEFTLQSIRK